MLNNILLIFLIIGRVPVDGYRSQRNYSVSAMTWLTYIEKKMKISHLDTLGTPLVSKS